MIAELFMVLAIIILYDSNFTPRLKFLLLVAFTASLAISHYGLLMIFVVCMTFSMFFILIFSLVLKTRHVNIKLIAALSIGMLFFLGLWFTDTSEYHLAHSMLSALKEMINEFFAFQAHESSIFFSIIESNGTPINNYVNIAIVLVLLFFILIALIDQLVAIRRKLGNFEPEYLALASTFLMVMVSGAYNSSILLYVSETRLIHITLLILAPLLPIGACVIAKKIVNLRVNKEFLNPNKIVMMCGISLILLILMTNSGLISYVAGQNLPFELEPTNSRPSFTENEVTAAEWAAQRIGSDDLIKADAHRTYLMVMYTGTYSPFYTENGVEIYPVLPHKSFYFYGEENIYGRIWLDDLNKPRLNNTMISIPSDFSNHMFTQNMVYNSGSSVFYYDNYE
jgi:uncharacterized membrane protein